MKYLMNIIPAAFISATVLLAGCGLTKKSDDNGPGPSVQGSANLAELESSSPTAVPSLVSAFGLVDGSAAGFAAFYSGKRYFSGVVKELSAQSFQVMGIIGTYDDSSGTQIVPSGKRTTCQEFVTAARASGEKSQIVGTVDGQSLTITRGAETVVLQRFTPGAPTSGIVVEWGCFDLVTGAFTPQGWSDIK
jgi:hypothetical protein